MKITHVNDWGGHTVIIDEEIYDHVSESRFLLKITGYGKTKADAVKSGIVSIGRLNSEIKEMREKLSAL